MQKLYIVVNISGALHSLIFKVIVNNNVPSECGITSIFLYSYVVIYNEVKMLNFFIVFVYLNLWGLSCGFICLFAIACSYMLNWNLDMIIIIIIGNLL